MSAVGSSCHWVSTASAAALKGNGTSDQIMRLASTQTNEFIISLITDLFEDIEPNRPATTPSQNTFAQRPQIGHKMLILGQFHRDGHLFFFQQIIVGQLFGDGR